MAEGSIKKSLRRKLTNQYVGIFTIVYFLLLIGIMFTIVHAEYYNVEKNVKDNIYKKIYSHEDIINKAYVYNDGYESFIKSFAEYNSKSIIIRGVGAMPTYEYLKNITLLKGVKYFAKTGNIIFKYTDYNKERSITFIKFELLNYLRDNVFIDEINLLLATFLLAYILGVILFISIGDAKTKKALKPIHDLTILTASINERSLDLRIDVESAKYELKELCITLNSMLERIEKVYVKQKSFVSDVSHELRTPISVIDGYVNMLKRWGSDDKIVLDESIEAILYETKNMKELVEALLFLVRYDNQTIKYEKETIDVGALLEEVYQESKLVDKQNHDIHYDAKDNLTCLGDYNKLKESLRIFIDNSIKYTKEKKQIWITGDEIKNTTVISIKDQGIGIAKQHLGNIFNRFYRADSSRSKKTGGIGLGLSIARAIILAHNGKIKIKSKENVGTIVEIYLPKA